MPEIQENPRPGVEVTRSFSIVLSESSARVLIEYKPSGYTTTKEELREAAAAVREDTETPVEFLSDLYTELVEDLFPGYSSYPDPWEKVPMVVEYMEVGDNCRSTSTLGRFE